MQYGRAGSLKLASIVAIASCASVPLYARSQDTQMVHVKKSLNDGKLKLTSGYVHYTQTTIYKPGFRKLNKDLQTSLGTVTSACEYAFDQSRQHRLTRQNGMVDSHYKNKTGTQFYKKHTGADGKPNILLTYVKKPVHFSNILDFGYRMEGKWIADLVDEGHFKFLSEKDHPDFGPTLVIEGRTAAGAQCTITLAVQLGMAISYTKRPGNGDSITKRVQEIEMVDGIPFPKRAEVAWLVVVNGEVEPYMSIEYEVQRVILNKVPKGFLDVPKLPPGATIKDDRVGKFFEVGPKGELIYKGSFDNRDPQKSGGVFRWFGWLFVGGNVCLLLGGLRFVAVRRAKLFS